MKEREEGTGGQAQVTHCKEREKKGYWKGDSIEGYKPKRERLKCGKENGVKVQNGHQNKEKGKKQ